VTCDPARGAFLNGRHVKLQGVSIHQDHAGVGVAVPDAIWAYRLRRLKELGANAIRFTHGAPAAEILDMADRMGFLVMDENRNFNISPDYLPQLEWLVRRDRHHPSVVLWSLFNEEPMQSTEAGYQMTRTMAAAVKALDDTRPVTAAMNGGFFGPYSVAHALDVVGANYQVDAYDKFHQQFPNVPFTSSEDTSAFMTRGVYSTDQSTNVFASYDEDYASWGNSHRDAWEAIARRPYVAGGFVWTGFDYRGEPTPNQWPAGVGIRHHGPEWFRQECLLHPSGAVDQRPATGAHSAALELGRPRGQQIRVMVMSNADKVALLLNGQLLGEQQVDPYRMNYFQVAYAPGKLEALAYRDGKQVAHTSVETTGAAVRIELVPDRGELRGDGRDAMPITVRALDAQGRPYRWPMRRSALPCMVPGGLGHGNGDPTSHEDEQGADAPVV
jgi:beta-galactosidase